jgi:hypothetical protein
VMKGINIMRYAVKICLILMTALLLVFALSSSKSQTCSEPEVQLKTTVEKFIGHKKNQNYMGVWSLLSKRLKHANDDDQEEYEKYVRSGGFSPSSLVVGKIVEGKEEALVTVEVTYVDVSGSEIGKSLEEWKFVKNSCSWFFDDYKTLSELLK